MNNNSSIGKRYKMIEVKGETFSWKKFFTGFFAFNRVNFAKDIVSLFSIRKLIIYFLIIGMIFGYGYWQGASNQPLLIDIGEYKEANIKLHDMNLLNIDKNGNVTIRTPEGEILKRLKAKDLDSLKKQLKPFGFQLKPIAVIGSSIGTDGELVGEGGIGISWFRAWKIRLDSIVTTKGLYPIGLSYKLDGIGLDNSAIGIAVGTGYDNFLEDKRILAYFRIAF